MKYPDSDRKNAFTLVELLVVVSITALLMAVLLPSLRRARDSSKYVACSSNLRQIGTGIHLYAQEHANLIPRGPDPASPFDFQANNLATNQLWIGEGSPAAPADHPREYNGLGRLLDTVTKETKLFYCPADNAFNLREERPKIGTENDAFGSYLYRQLDHLPEPQALGRLDNMGFNLIGDQKVRVEALALDTNSLGPAEMGMRHTNHRAESANVLFRDASVRKFLNRDNVLAIPPDAFFERIPPAIDQLLTNADFAYQGDPAAAPRLEDEDPS